MKPCIVALTALLASCSGPGSDEWEARCLHDGGHVYKQYVYKGSIYLCLTSDGRIIELGDGQ
jgi:hypothetical protein